MSLIFEGRALEVLPGETIAETLLRSGVAVFSRGPKYHRPRGPFCLNDTCAQCHMRVDGEPNVPTCITPAGSGVEVERQNVMGSGDLDLLRAVDFLYPEGLDHHHLMTRFRFLSAATQAVARRLAGVGQVPTQGVAPPEVVHREEAVVVVGAGRSGLAAASALLRAGIRPLVLEAHDSVGGWSDQVGLAEEVQGCVSTGTRVMGIYPEGQGARLIARDRHRVWQILARHVVAATGGIERPLLFEGNDLPGIFAGRSFSRLKSPPGRRAVILGADADALRVAERLTGKNIDVVAVLDMVGGMSASRTPVLRADPIRAVGRSRVSGLRFRSHDGQGGVLKCDLILSVAPLAPSFELAAEAGAPAELGGGGFAVLTDGSGATNVPWLHAAGAVTSLRIPGERVGAAVAHCTLADRL